MTNQNQKKQEAGINPMAAAVTGAVIGAGVVAAGAVAIALEDKKNREKVKKVLTNVKKQVQDKKNDVQEKFTEGKEKVNKVTKLVKNSLEHALKDVKKAAH